MWEFTHTEIIDAPCEKVFRIISDLPNYKNWNPFLVSASGNVEVGGVVKGKSFLGKITTPYRHKIFEFIPNKSLCWRDFGFASLFVRGERSRFVKEENGKTVFTCHLRLTGPLSGIVNAFFGKGLRDGIVAEAKAISEYCMYLDELLKKALKYFQNDREWSIKVSKNPASKDLWE